MSDRLRVRAVFLSTLLCWATRVVAQQPLGNEFVVGSTSVDVLEQIGPEVACDRASICGVFWLAVSSGAERRINEIWGATYSPQGELLTRQLLHEGGPGFAVVHPVPLANGFALFWDRYFPDGRAVPVLQLFDESLRPLGDAVDLPFQWPYQYQNPRSYGLTFAAVSIPQGFALVSQGLDRPLLEPGSLGVYLYFVDSQGRLLRERVRVNEKTSGHSRLNPYGLGGLAVDGSGNLVVAFSWGPEKFRDDEVYVRRFSPDGTPLGPQVRVNTFTKGMQQNAEVAALPDGRFLVAWQSTGQDGSDDGIYGRLFSVQGHPLGREFRVNELTLSPQRFPWITADAAGHFFIGWQSGHPFSEILSWEVKGRFYDVDGTPLSGEIHVNQDRLNQQDRTKAAFTLDGTLFVVWHSASPRQTQGQYFVPVARRFSVPE